MPIERFRSDRPGRQFGKIFQRPIAIRSSAVPVATDDGDRRATMGKTKLDSTYRGVVSIC